MVYPAGILVQIGSEIEPDGISQLFKGIDSMERILFFDGVCNLCNRLVIFIIRHDRKGLIKFAPLQSGRSRELLAEPVSEANPDSIVYLVNGKKHFKADAILFVLKDLGGFWKMTGSLLRIFPAGLRNYFYDLIAKHRYSIFGKRDECMVPSEDIRQRFLTD